ncbi:FeoB-associated Cys-rich membrane protein [Desulfosporosinus metallidurans]
MINWIIGGVIVGVTVFIVVRTIVRMRKGESSCCGNCTQSKSDCCK